MVADASRKVAGRLTDELQVWSYIGLVTLAAVGLLGIFVPRLNVATQEYAWAAAIALATYFGARFVIHVAPKMKLEVSSASVLAAVLLLPVPMAMLAVAAGQMAAAVHLKRSWRNVCFNGSEVALRAGIGGLVFGLFFGGPILVESNSSLALALGSFAAAAAMYGANTSVVSALVALQVRASFLQVWRTGRRDDIAPEFAMYSIGLAAALLARTYPWVTPLMAIPVVMVYIALKDRYEKMLLGEQLSKQLLELRETQAQLVRSARLASVGTLAAGVAHEINNPIFLISGNSELLLRDPERHFKSKEGQQAVNTIYDMAQRVARIVGNLLNYSRSKGPPEEFSLNESIDHVLELAEHSLAGRRVLLERHYHRALPPIMGQMSEVEQVTMNLITNARDAMPPEGKLTITTGIEGKFVKVSFDDTGVGITPEIRERIFDPFFTTKAPGKGTGLGLYVAKRIVDEHGGEIRLESKAGQGSVFTVLFPMVPAKTTEAARSAVGGGVR